MLLRAKNYGKIAAGKALKKSFSADLPGGASASGKYVIALIDAGEDVVEADEADNVAVFGPLP